MLKLGQEFDVRQLRALASAAMVVGSPERAEMLDAAADAIERLRRDVERRDRIDEARRRGGYVTRGMVAQRDQASRTDGLCSDAECALSGGYAHAGPCEPCDCGLEHAKDECPVDEVHAPPAIRMSSFPQCGVRDAVTSMTFRNADNSISRKVTCKGCLAVEALALEGGKSPEKFPEQFDPDKHLYREYIDRPERTPTHLVADIILDKDEDAVKWVQTVDLRRQFVETWPSTARVI